MSDFSIPINIEERDGLHRAAEAIRIGVPLPRGLLREGSAVIVTDATGVPVLHQTRVLGRWSDRSVKWLLVDALARVGARERTALLVRATSAASSDQRGHGAEVRVTARSGAVDVDTGFARFEIKEKHSGPFASVWLGASNVLGDGGSAIRLIAHDRTYEAVVESLSIEEAGPLRATVVSEGSFSGASGIMPLRFKARAVFTAGSAAVSFDFQLRNPQAAVHPGGLWDLGDPGSYVFADLTIIVHPRGAVQALRWYAERPSDACDTGGAAWSIYQDSSGGDHWNSPNHIDRNSTSTVGFRGYRVTGPAGGQSGTIAEGHRATPAVTVFTADAWVAASTRDFWQNFPKALRWEDGALSVGVFPRESRSGFELQGGEQKRHTMFFEFGAPAQHSHVAELQYPVATWVDPEWAEASHAVLWLAAPSDKDDLRYLAYIQQIVEGPNTFVARREIIDEYGWRNFGELYADHEAVHHRGPSPFVSHYNNQYDFVYGAFVHFLRTGDPRWRQLLDDAARHVIDIDLYHTQDDKAAFNGGMFWHTDHYLPARTCSHRTYSRRNGGSAGYGGGPANEHNYTSGLLHYHYLTGDPEAAQAVRELADWVVAMDDGARTLFGLIDAGPTGGASRTLEATFHSPGRGAGNSINALLDAYTLSRERAYLVKAEDIIQRCVHPSDDIAALHLDEPEHRWSYLVFLQVLGKYLAKKTELGEADYAFHYARESLLHYAAWMAEHEVPYKDVLDKVEIPTETWPAHDVRKAHVLHVAASYSQELQRARFEERATFFFDRCLTDLLGFSTANVTRPLVILCNYGSVESFFRRYRCAPADTAVHNHAFAPRAAFVPQRARLRSSLARRLKVLGEELRRVIVHKRHSVMSRVRRSP